MDLLNIVVGIGQVVAKTVDVAVPVIGQGVQTAFQFARAAAPALSQTGWPIIQSLGSHSRLIEHMNHVSLNVVQSPNATHVNSFLQELSWFNFSTGYNSGFDVVERTRERTESRTEVGTAPPQLKPANLSALQDKDLEAELKRNQALMGSFLAARNKLLTTKDLITPDQLKNANQQILAIVRDAELRNQGIMAEFQKRRAETAKPITDREQRVMNADWGDRVKLNATRVNLKEENAVARQRVLDTYDQELKSREDHGASMLTGYKVASSNEKTLKANHKYQEIRTEEVPKPKGPH